MISYKLTVAIATLVLLLSVGFFAITDNIFASALWASDCDFCFHIRRPPNGRFLSPFYCITLFPSISYFSIHHQKSFTYSEKSEEARTEYLSIISDILPENHVFIDECGHEEDYIRPYGRALRGVRVQDVKRGRKFGRTNVVTALCHGIVLAPKCYKHGTNSEFFEEWFKNELLPLLKKEQTITLDNASFHRKKATFRNP